MDISKVNKRKWLHPPDAEMIDAFIKSLKVSAPRFEAFYGIPKGTLRLVRCGARDLPAKFWHIIYERVEPKYGVGFAEPLVTVSRNRQPARKPILPATKSVTKPQINHKVEGRLKDLFE